MTSPGIAVPDSVRLALPQEAAAIAEVQRRCWSATLPGPTAQALLGGIDVAEMTDAWHAAVLRPPQAACRVLVALEGTAGGPTRLVGFAATAPAGDPDAVAGQDGAVAEFAVDPPAQRRGHGSRLLHACVDTLRADGFRRATWWVASTDDVLRRFLTEAGWAPDGGRREIGRVDDGVRIRQVRLHTDISA